MLRRSRTRFPSIALAGTAAAGIISASPALANDYDMDCKLLLCMPGGFPSGCADAYEHMIDRLRKGKSPIGHCEMSDGSGYDAYEIDYEMQAAPDPEGWACPAGKSLYHDVDYGDVDGYDRTVTTFCYTAAYARRGWNADGSNTITTYTDMTVPERTDFWVNLTLEAGTEYAYSQGWQMFDTGRGTGSSRVLHIE
ncbi:MAG: hypothetical protein AAF264_02985 [Pseudomonadota bacterium]